MSVLSTCSGRRTRFGSRQQPTHLTSLEVLKCYESLPSLACRAGIPPCPAVVLATHRSQAWVGIGFLPSSRIQARVSKDPVVVNTHVAAQSVKAYAKFQEFFHISLCGCLVHEQSPNTTILCLVV